MKKKLLLLIALMAICLSHAWAYDFSAVAPSGQTLYYNIVNGNAQVAYQNSSSPRYSNLTGALEIPPTVTYNGNTYSVTSIGRNAFYGCSGLTSVNIPNSVTTIEQFAFRNCRGLTNVTIPDSVDSIGRSAFYNCSGLTSMTIPNSVSAIGEATFSGCSGLTSINIPNSVTSIGNSAFDECIGLTSVTIPNSVTSIGDWAFDECSGLTSMNIPNSVTSIGNFAFAYCSGLTSVTISNSVITIGEYAFSTCSGLTSVTMEGVTPPTLDESAFYHNAPNRKFYVPCGAYNNYYEASSWTEYRSELNEPVVDINVTVNTDAERGITTIIPLGGHDVRCDSTVVVMATANYGYHFDHWSTGSTQEQDTIAIDRDTIITGYFAKNQYTINVVANYSERGNVSGSDTIDYLDSATISAEAIYGYCFTRWNDNDTHRVRTVQVTQNKTYTAYFDYNQYQLTVASANTVQGSCSGSGAYNYLSNRNISATANYGYHFTQWSDGNTDNPRIIQLTQDTLFTAEFAINQYEITLVSGNTDLGQVNGGGTFDYLDTITLTATTIAEHHHFVRWSDGNRENPRLYVVTEDETLTAYFAVDTHSVVVVSNDPTRGMVTSSGSEFEYLSPCTVTATAYTGFVFTGWSNGVTANPYTFAVQNDVELTAIFVSEDELMFTITVEADDPTMGSVSGGGMAMSGGEVTINAVANEGYHFVRWNDNDTNADRTVTVTADATYTAYFAADQTEGIDEVEQMPTIVVRGNSIAVGNAQGQMLSIYDITGRMIVSEKAVEGKQYLVPHSGVYMVQVGNYPAQKVVVVR